MTTCPNCGHRILPAGLTRRQADALEYIVKYIDDNGIPPSIREMSVALSLASVGGVMRLVDGLEERGYISRIVNRSRSITVLHRIPQDAAE